MTITVKELHELNVSRNKELNEINKEYYMNMASYLRTSHVSPKQAEEILLELLDHMIILQMEGVYAIDAFGDDPKNYCDEIIKELTKENWKHKLLNNWKLFSLLFLIVLLYSSFQGRDEVGFNLLIMSTLLAFSLTCSFRLLKSISFRFRNKIKLLILLFFEVFLMIPIFLFDHFFLTREYIVFFRIEPMIMGGFSFILLLLIFFLYKKKMISWLF